MVPLSLTTLCQPAQVKHKLTGPGPFWLSCPSLQVHRCWARLTCNTLKCWMLRTSGPVVSTAHYPILHNHPSLQHRPDHRKGWPRCSLESKTGQSQSPSSLEAGPEGRQGKRLATQNQSSWPSAGETMGVWGRQACSRRATPRSFSSLMCTSVNG